ncbi:hypothetical protein EMCG_06236 [[Emmonsia] crescens]|uniref:Uncharacterized protein n=1 Tax=[Emmonsia] crescens TaxID=73230 RepID=A0A0G2JBT2_9EURO|nr:hypothetical protein EMCG_06236 [Emmonsia crescens UAMH 3008]
MRDDAFLMDQRVWRMRIYRDERRGSDGVRKEGGWEAERRWVGGVAPKVVVRNGGEERLSEMGDWFGRVGLGAAAWGDNSSSELSATVEVGHRVAAAVILGILACR